MEICGLWIIMDYGLLWIMDYGFDVMEIYS